MTGIPLSDMTNMTDERYIGMERVPFERVLGAESVTNTNPAVPRPRRSSRDERVWPSKALKVLGITVDEIQIDKALRVLGEHPTSQRAFTE